MWLKILQSFSQYWATVFRSMYAFLGIISRIVDTRIYIGKCCDKTCDISDLCHKLRIQRRSYTLQYNDNWIFRQLGGGFVHTGTKLFNGL